MIDFLYELATFIDTFFFKYKFTVSINKSDCDIEKKLGILYFNKIEKQIKKNEKSKNK